MKSGVSKSRIGRPRKRSIYSTMVRVPLRDDLATLLMAHAHRRGLDRTDIIREVLMEKFGAQLETS